jgi:hypothetical protein
MPRLVGLFQAASRTLFVCVMLLAMTAQRILSGHHARRPALHLESYAYGSAKAIDTLSSCKAVM